MPFSSPDLLAMVAEIYTRRAAMVCGKVAKSQGLTLKQFLDTAPEQRKQQLKLIGEMHHRYMKGKYQHEEKELLQIESYCNWLVTIEHERVGQVGRPIMFDARLMQQTERCSKRMYIKLIAKIHSEL